MQNLDTKDTETKIKETGRGLGFLSGMVMVQGYKKVNTLLVTHYIKLIQIKVSLDLTFCFLSKYLFKKSSPEFTTLN